MSPGTAELPASGSLNEVVDGNPSVTPFVGLRWMSADLSDYYYGVRPAEVGHAAAHADPQPVRRCQLHRPGGHLRARDEILDC